MGATTAATVGYIDHTRRRDKIHSTKSADTLPNDEEACARHNTRVTRSHCVVIPIGGALFATLGSYSAAMPDQNNSSESVRLAVEEEFWIGPLN